MDDAASETDKEDPKQQYDPIQQNDFAAKIQKRDPEQRGDIVSDSQQGDIKKQDDTATENQKGNPKQVISLPAECRSHNIVNSDVYQEIEAGTGTMYARNTTTFARSRIGFSAA